MEMHFTDKNDDLVTVEFSWAPGKQTTIDLPHKDVIDTLREHTGRSSGVIPPAVRWISADMHGVVFERPPHEVLVSYYGGTRSVASKMTEQQFILSLPWTVYGIRFDEHYNPSVIYVYAMKDGIAAPGLYGVGKRYLHLLPITNCYGSGQFCLPAYTEVFDERPKTLSEGIVLAYESVWGSNFNLDLYECLTQMYAQKAYPNVLQRIPNQYFSGANVYKAWELLGPRVFDIEQAWTVSEGHKTVKDLLQTLAADTLGVNLLVKAMVDRFTLLK